MQPAKSSHAPNESTTLAATPLACEQRLFQILGCTYLAGAGAQERTIGAMFQRVLRPRGFVAYTQKIERSRAECQRASSHAFFKLQVVNA
jgi:hypothetical protein